MFPVYRPGMRQKLQLLIPLIAPCTSDTSHVPFVPALYLQSMWISSSGDKVKESSWSLAMWVFLRRFRHSVKLSDSVCHTDTANFVGDFGVHHILRSFYVGKQQIVFFGYKPLWLLLVGSLKCSNQEILGQTAFIFISIVNCCWQESPDGEEHNSNMHCVIKFNHLSWQIYFLVAA